MNVFLSRFILVVILIQLFFLIYKKISGQILRINHLIWSPSFRPPTNCSPRLFLSGLFLLGVEKPAAQGKPWTASRRLKTQQNHEKCGQEDNIAGWVKTKTLWRISYMISKWNILHTNSYNEEWLIINFTKELPQWSIRSDGRSLT